MENKNLTDAAIEQVDVAIIGAGPAGAAAAAWLAREGLRVRVLEQSVFPRFSIGESLLPQCMQYLQECGLLAAAEAGGFQHKDGAAFCWRDETAAVLFTEKFSAGPGTTWQVPRADFDQRLIEGAQALGADVLFGCKVTTTTSTLCVGRQRLWSSIGAPHWAGLRLSTGVTLCALYACGRSYRHS